MGVSFVLTPEKGTHTHTLPAVRVVFVDVPLLLVYLLLALFPNHP